MLLEACLGMRINAAKNRVTFCHPRLPSFLNDITITNLRINNKQIVLQIRKRSEGIDAIVLSPGTNIEVEILDKELEFA